MSEMNPHLRISVVVPFLDPDSPIEECLGSVLNQDVRDIEVILAGNGPESPSRVAMMRAAARDPRVRVLPISADQGLPSGSTVRGTYVLFLEPHDLLKGPHALRTLLDAAERSHCRVVIGSAERSEGAGAGTAPDQHLDHEPNGCPGAIVDGRAAFLGCLGGAGSQRVPLRAWGTLIERDLYQRLGLDYPARPREAMAYTPFLYCGAGRICRTREVVVLHRDAEAPSRKCWSEMDLARYGALWQTMKKRMQALGLESLMGDAAAAFATRLIREIDAMDSASMVAETAARIMEEILADLSSATSGELLFGILDALPRWPWLSTRDPARHRAMLAHMPDWAVLAYHRANLARDSFAASAQAPVFSGPGLAANAAVEARILAEYEEVASARVKAIPAMLTRADRAIYFHAARNFAFHGSIVEGGCFVGGTTLSLIEGLRHNARTPKPESLRGLIRVYDRFAISEDYILDHLRRSYPRRRFARGESFLPLFEENLAPERDLLQIRAGDVTAIGYPDAEPIGLFGVDFCKSPVITDFVVRTFFPRLLPGAFVLQQDFVHEFHPHIHLAMLRLAEYFAVRIEPRWGGTVAFTCVKPITEAIVHRCFGEDLGWYKDAETNISLLRGLIEGARYDENRWIFLLALGVYLLAQGRREDARAAYREARARFPSFTPAKEAREMLEG